MSEQVKCLIIGSGPAGYTASIYAARSNMSPVLYSGLEPGGQLTTTNSVENFPGYPDGIDGTIMMEDFKQQAKNAGAEIRSGLITAVDFSSYPYKITVDGKTKIEARSVIISTGASAKYLGLEDEKKYAGSGVSACATCDGFFYRKKIVAVAGGGDTACEESMHLSHLADKVYMIVRKDYLRASKVMQERVEKAPNIEILFEHEVLGLSGDGVVESAKLLKRRGKEDESSYEIAIDGLFLAIGHHPNSDIFKEWLETDEVGYIKTDPGRTSTNVPGVFAAGDVADPKFRQAITAAATGCMAAIEAEEYLSSL